MTAKEYLNQLMSIEKLIQLKTTERERLMALATKVTSALSDCKVETSPDNTKTQNIIIKMTELREEIEEQASRYTSLYRKIEEEIDDIEDDRYKLLLIMRYMKGASFSDIADKLGYEKRWTLVLHKRALKDFEKRHCI
jgi:hypothetical protein|nr:MAG TPA: Protein of unknown function (DUF1492) [Caudoviricetes sp.]